MVSVSSLPTVSVLDLDRLLEEMTLKEMLSVGIGSPEPCPLIELRLRDETVSIKTSDEPAFSPSNVPISILPAATEREPIRFVEIVSFPEPALTVIPRRF